jgi:hypothetical protein
MGSNFMMRRAFKTVLKKFRDNNALTPETAAFANDLGIKPRGFFQFRGLRDYKPTVLDFMIKQDIVHVTEEGKVFLSEEVLARSGIEAKIGTLKK